VFAPDLVYYMDNRQRIRLPGNGGSMKFDSLKKCADFLAKEGELVRITDMVDPHLEMAEITRRVFEAGGPALLFENVKNSKFPALSNLYGTWARTKNF
jgi:4-hydroxy-3-polyprenylbenzoate decarboxylase